MHRTLLFGTAGMVCWSSLLVEPRPAPSGNAVIRGKAGSSEVVITTTDRVAGAIHSLKWDGKEFINSHDHGRQLQSAASFDCAAAKEFWAECFNPTEAGSRADSVGDRSSSKLLRISAEGPELRTTTQMAFWLAPGEKSFDRPALNDQILSAHLISKRVRIGYRKLANVIEYEVTFTVPKVERHTYAQFEALTGYMPPEFGQFWKFRPDSRKLEVLDDGPDEQEFPVVFATAGRTHAMGLFSSDQPSPGCEKIGLRPVPVQGGEGGQVELRLSAAKRESDPLGGALLSFVRCSRHVERREGGALLLGSRVHGSVNQQRGCRAEQPAAADVGSLRNLRGSGERAVAGVTLGAHPALRRQYCVVAS